MTLPEIQTARAADANSDDSHDDVHCESPCDAHILDEIGSDVGCHVQATRMEGAIQIGVG